MSWMYQPYMYTHGHICLCGHSRHQHLTKRAGGTCKAGENCECKTFKPLKCKSIKDIPMKYRKDISW